MRIKNWERTKYKRTNYSMWKNTLPIYKSFENNFYITVGRVGRTSDFFMNVTKQGKQIRSHTYDKRDKAISQAIKFMKSHPGELKKRECKHLWKPINTRLFRSVGKNKVTHYCNRCGVLGGKE